MIARFFQQILNSFGVVFRTFRAFFTRQVMGIQARVRRVTSFSRQAAKLVPKAMSSVAIAGKKPTKREDFVETKRLFVAKSLLVLLAVGAIALGLLIYFVIWPWLVRMFFTARLYQGDEAVATYSGKVIVCYDEEKEMTWLQGRMEEGAIEGQGQEYDEAGRILYEGNFAQGLYDGRGKLYSEGVLVYEGEFAAGLYDGSGTLYENGQVIYTGQFSEGLREGTGTEYAEGEISYKGDFSADVYEGEGTAYYPNGQVQYRGSYVAGLYSGEGTLYYEDGTLQYRGAFLEGAYDQEGQLYNADGSLLYEGGFLQGLYSGEGVLNLTPEMQITGTFEAGAPVGSVTITLSGKLYYQGQVQDYMPHGEGTLYASTGEAIYTGVFSGGVPDLGSLLGQTGDFVRAAFAEAELIETQGERNGFSINNQALGVTLFCTYKTETDDPTVYYVYAYEQDADSFAESMAWHNAEEFEADATEPYEKQERDESAVFTGGVPYPNGDYHRTAYYFEDYVFVGWSQIGQEEWIMVEWIANQDLPSGDSSSSSSESGGASRLDTLLNRLGLSEEGTSSGSADSAAQGQDGSSSAASSSSSASSASATSQADSTAASQSDSAAATSAYYGQAAPAALLTSGSATSGSSLTTALTAMVNYYLQAETREAAEERLALKQSLLDAAQLSFSMGNGSQEEVDSLSGEVSRLELAANQAAVAMERIQMEAGSALTGSLRDYDVSAALFIQDPATLPVEELLAVTWNGDSIRLALMDLELAWQEMQQAQTDYASARESAAAAEQDYAMGKTDAAARYDALCAQSEAAVALQEAICEYALQMINLNDLAGGLLAQEYGWLDALNQ